MMQDQLWQISSDDKQMFLPQLLNATYRAVFVIDLSGKIVYMNTAAMDEFGVNAPDHKGNETIRIKSPTSMREFLNQKSEPLLENKSMRGDFIFEDDHGSEYHISMLAFHLQINQQNLIGLIAQSPGKQEYSNLLTANKILREIDHILGDVVDYGVILKKFVEFVVPQLADLSAIYLVQNDQSIERVALSPATAIQNKEIYEWLLNDLPNDDTDGLPQVLSTGEARLIKEVPSVRRAFKAGIKSYMILPLVTHRQIRGAITFISTESNRYFTKNNLELAQNLAINISIYLEKNRLYKESQKLKDELEQRVNERTAELSEAITQLKSSEAMIQTLFSISNRLNATLEVDTILDELAQEAIKIVNGESGFAGLRTDKGMTVKKYFQMGQVIPFEHTWEMGEGIPGWVLKYKVPYGTSDAVNDPLINWDLQINQNVHSIICTPILDSAGEVIGYFNIRNKIGAEGFEISDQEMLLTLAPVASIAIQNALAYQQRLQTVAEVKESSKQLEMLAAKLESAREEERLYISRELHDQLGQALTAMKFDLTALSDRVKTIDDDLAHRSIDILTQVNTMIKTVRRISTELRPGMLDDLGLIASLEWQADEFQKRTGIACSVNGPSHDVDLSKEQALALYRISQEAFTNVARYAEAKNVEITLTTNGDELIYQFQDDGRGIPEKEVTGSQSLGLLGMRERVKNVGGRFEIKGQPGIGTTIKVTIPMRQ